MQPVVVLRHCTHDLVGRLHVLPGPGLGRVRERQSGRVYDAVIPDQRHGHLGGLSYPQPIAPERRYVGHYSQHALLAPVHGLGLDVAEPYLQMWRKIFAGQLKHGHVAATV